MGNFKREKFGTKKKFGRDSGFKKDRNRSDRPAMHQAICSQCGKKCELPFKPSGNRPVFCSECFDKRGSNNHESDNRHEDHGFDKKESRATISAESYKQDFELINSKLDDILTMLAEVIMNKNGDREDEEFLENTEEVVEIIEEEVEVKKGKAKSKPKAEKEKVKKTTAKKKK